MSYIENLVRPNILKLKPYSSARHEFTGTARVHLDANESPYNNGYNRYPDPLQQSLKEKIATIKSVTMDQIFLGNGSDEAIDLIYRIFCEPSRDKVMICPPTYGMYEVSANIHDIELVKVPLQEDFQLDLVSMQRVIENDKSIKVLWICSPNNPTGNTIRSADIETITGFYKGIIVIDEAYIDFSDTASWTSQLDNRPRVIVLQTFSKAWGAAAIRVGMAFASSEIISLMNKVKAPYNLNLLTQEKTLELIDSHVEIEKRVETVIAQREWLKNQLEAFSFVIQVHPSDANFLLVHFKNSTAVFEYLRSHGIVVRDRSKVLRCGNCLRITVGKQSENEELIETLKAFES